MNYIKKIASVLILTSSLVTAGYATTQGAYVGGALGYGKLDNFGDTTGGDGGVAGRILVGYNFNKFFGLEGGYNRYAKTTFTLSNGNTADYDVTAGTLAIKGYLPVNNQVDFYGLLGMATVQAQTTSDDMYFGAGTRSEFGVMAGVGINYDITSKVSTNLEFSRTQGHTSTYSQAGIPFANLLSLGVAYHFN
ncbi:MAG: outer membrane beta-barrel protein [Gammaproteobacteria bacterium]|nr:outer membrane beta-barrel protein [Gammaproteobacteria bacterium]